MDGIITGSLMPRSPIALATVAANVVPVAIFDRDYSNGRPSPLSPLVPLPDAARRSLGRYDRLCPGLVRINGFREAQTRRAFPDPRYRSANRLEAADCNEHGCSHLQARRLINSHAVRRQITDAMPRRLRASETFQRGGQKDALASFPRQGRAIVRFGSVGTIGHAREMEKNVDARNARQRNGVFPVAIRGVQANADPAPPSGMRSNLRTKPTATNKLE